MRIGINIPKDLHQRLQPLKGSINISQICREALEARVDKYEEFVGWLDSEHAKEAIAGICDKEMQRKAIVEVDWETIGYQDAKDWVQGATLPDWDYWNRCRNHPDRSNQNFIWLHGRHVRSSKTRGEFVTPDGAKTFFQRHREYMDLIHDQDDEFWEWMHEQYDGLGPLYEWESSEQAYGRAWMTYTSAVWEMICQLRDERATELQNALLKSIENRPVPEVPERIAAEIRRGK